jgi:hypothetical protein
MLIFEEEEMKILLVGQDEFQRTRKPSSPPRRFSVG